MSERRALLDPEMYKISEEDSQDEEVLSGGSTLNKEANSAWNKNEAKIGPSQPSGGQKDACSLSGLEQAGRGGQVRREIRVKWPPQPGGNGSSDDASLSGDDGETDESRETDCWTCSSKDESGDESWSSTSSSRSSSSSCSSCESRKISRKQQGKVEEGEDSSSRHHFLANDKSRTRRGRFSNYLASETDIQTHTDLDGNVRIIEFYSSDEREEEEDEEERKNPMEPPVRSEAQIEETFSELTFPAVSTHHYEAQKTGGGAGRISRFLSRNAGDDNKRTTEQRGILEAGKRNRDLEPGTSSQTSSLDPTGSIFAPGRPRGEIRDVSLTLRPECGRHGDKSGRSLLESLLGIIPDKPICGDEVELVERAEVGRRLNSGRREQERRNAKDRILIGGFIPNSPAAKSRHLREGDWVRTINGIVVNPLNVDFILSALQQRHPRAHSATAKHQIKIGITRRGVAVAKGRVGHDTGDIDRILPSNEQQTLRDSDKNTLLAPEEEQQRDAVFTLNPTDQASPIFIIFVSNKSESSDPNHVEYFRYSDKKLGEGDPNSSSGLFGATRQIVYVWPTKEERNASSEHIYESLKNTIPMAVTIYGVLKEEIGYAHARSRMEFGEVTMDVEFGSDDTGESLLLVMRTVGGKQEMRLDAGSISVAEWITGVLTFKWATLERAFDKVNHRVITKLLGNILNVPRTELGSFLPLVPRVPMDINVGEDIREPFPIQLKEEIYDELCQFDAGQSMPFNDNDLDTNGENVYSMGAAIFLRGKLLSTTLPKDILPRAYWWTLAELNWVGKSRWPFCKRILLYQRTAFRGSTFSLLIGKDDLMMLLLLKSTGSADMLTKRQIHYWVTSASSILYSILTITSAMPTGHSRLPDGSDRLPWDLEEDAQSDGIPRPRRRNFIGNAWSNLKNKVTRKSFPAQAHGERQRMPQERLRGAISTMRLLKEYKILSVIKIDPVRGVMMTCEDDWMGHAEEWTRIQMGIRQALQMLNNSDECGHLVLNSSHRPRGVWVGGRAGSGGKKVIIAVMGRDAGENLQKILDKIEQDN